VADHQLFIGCFLMRKFTITIYEKTKSCRNFFSCGKGGFNLTHSEPIGQLIKRYTPDDFLDKRYYSTNTDFRNWLDKVGFHT
jgi:predicted flavoprotein YhiN